MGESRVDGRLWEQFEATAVAGSPWDARHQHGGPVAALLVRAMDRCSPRPATRLSRITVEILGPVPTGPARVSARIMRPGRRIELLAAEFQSRLPDGSWRTVATAAAWRLATRDTEAVAHQADPPARGLDAAGQPVADTVRFDPPSAWRHGFVEALDIRVSGERPVTAWLRLTVPLVAGETVSPLHEAVAIADVANGIGARLDVEHWTFLNTELTVHLFEGPQPGWIGLTAEASIGGDGVGLSAATLHDARGPIGRVAQALLVEPRG